MLTMREPISLHVQRPIQKIQQDLSERMQANYGLMSLPIRKEELLHITSEPPEVYFGEDNTFQIFNHIKTEDQQNLRLDVINNVINRILVAQTDNFTYQDTVYISSVLRKLGIRDEKLFMKQVFQLQQEQKETTALLRQYEQHQELLLNFFQQEKGERQMADRQAEVPAAQMQRYYLHDEIFKRLETGKIYQDLHFHTKGIRHESQQIFRNEYSIGEQAVMAKQLHLHSLKQKLMQMDTPLLYFHQNQYEFLQETLEEMSQTTEERISAAVLLNLIDQSYALRQQQIEENSHNWYSLAGALFQTAENTWKRFESNLQERKYVSEQMQQTWETVRSIKQREGDMIQHIVQEYDTLQQEFSYITEQTELTQPRYLQEGNREEISLQGDRFYLTQEELKLEYLQEAGEEADEEAAAEITVEQIQQQLEQIRQKNYENYQKLQQIEMKQPIMKERKGDRRRAQRDALRALENSEEVMQEFFAQETEDTVQKVHRGTYEKLYELFSEETKEIYRQFLRQSPAQTNTLLQEIMHQPVETLQKEEHVEKVHTMIQETEQDIQLQRMIEKQIRRQEQEKLTERIETRREQQFSQIDFVHKKEERLLDEEMLETIRTQQTQARREEHTQEQVLHRDQKTQTVVQNAMHNMQVQQTQNIDELVQQKVRKQLNQLSDQIYGKIEKKLSTERKRRGY